MHIFKQRVVYSSHSLAFDVSVVQLTKQSQSNHATDITLHKVRNYVNLISITVLPITHDVPDKSVEETLCTVSDVQCSTSNRLANFGA